MTLPTTPADLGHWLEQQPPTARLEISRLITADRTRHIASARLAELTTAAAAQSSTQEVADLLGCSTAKIRERRRRHRATDDDPVDYAPGTPFAARTTSPFAATYRGLQTWLATLPPDTTTMRWCLLLASPQARRVAARVCNRLVTAEVDALGGGAAATATVASRLDMTAQAVEQRVSRHRQLVRASLVG